MKTTYKTTEIATLCQVRPATVGNWIKKGKLVAKRIGNKPWEITGKNLLAFLEANDMTAEILLVKAGSACGTLDKEEGNG